LNKLHKMIWNS